MIRRVSRWLDVMYCGVIGHQDIFRFSPYRHCECLRCGRTTPGWQEAA